MSDYHPFRPKFHFTPPANWMNDPNGLVHDGEVYHLFYQHNPYDTAWGHMSWGHAVSRDLVRWEHLPVAISEAPDVGYTIFSGSAVIDRTNSSGFGEAGVPPLVAIYTADHAGPERRRQTIHIAYSTDRGRTFTEYAGNPVIDEDEAKFGDPKVFWHVPTQRWILVAIVGHEQGHVVLYGSEDLKTWTPLSAYHAPDVAPGVWECPDLFPLRLDGVPAQTRWVLKVNCTRAPGELPATRWFLGDFDGERFTSATPLGRSLTSDDGAIYAEVTYNHVPDGRRILMGWLREQPHVDRPWTGAQSMPRVLTLRTGAHGPELRQRPVLDVHALCARRWTFPEQPLAGEWTLDGVDLSGRALELSATFSVDATCGFRLTLDDGSQLSVGFDKAAGALFIDPGDGRRITTPCSPTDDLVTVRVFLDQAIVEAFGPEAELDTTAAVTGFMPYGAAYERLSVFAEGGSVKVQRLDIWSLAQRERG
ncbi:MAG: glycoside hydrolase family 32 protein [Anaerolineae bacterium]